jgi:hypothetical protein
MAHVLRNLELAKKEVKSMKIATTCLTGLLLIGSVVTSATAMASDDGLLLKEGSEGYCHMKFRAMEPRTLGSDNPAPKSANSGDVIDFYGPCDESATGENQVRQQKIDRLFLQNAR